MLEKEIVRPLQGEIGPRHPGHARDGIVESEARYEPKLRSGSKATGSYEEQAGVEISRW
jgi:hypothetical protein